MIPELGHFSLILAFLLSCLLAVVPLVGTFSRNDLWISTARPLSTGVFVFTLISFLILAYSFLKDDFSVAYVASNSNSMLPIQYKFSAVWGGHEGSLLLWVLILAFWSFSVACFSRSLPKELVARVLSVMGMIGVGFMLFTLLTSNPFDRILPNAPLDGNDLNPLLQDFGLIIHPPMLYMGYVGFSVAFAFAIAALLGGNFDAAWARWSRPWTNVAWLFLTVGIALGSWWAYYELGWGGWWFWDPVENASLMPWLVGTALVHSLAATEKRGVFKSWTLLLAIFAFSLSLLGTFLVRSGVLTSVHSFAADPERGLFILVFLAVVVGGSLTLYAFRVPTVASKATYRLLSRENFILVNNVILVVVCVTVLLGTIYPIILDAYSGNKISVGPPYFNAIVMPLMALLAAFLGVGPLLRWKKTSKQYLQTNLLAAFIASAVVGFSVPMAFGGNYSFIAAGAVMLAAWITLSICVGLKLQLRNADSVMSGLRKLSPSYYGMMLAHLGAAICAVGIGITSQYNEERDIRMVAGDTLVLGPYEFLFEGVTEEKGPNYVANIGKVVVTDGGSEIAVLLPEKRSYTVRKNMMTEAAIDPGLFRDLYVALGEPLPKGAWAVRIQYKPFIRWIWLGAIFMAFGAALTVFDKRYRVRVAQPDYTKTNVPTGQLLADQ